ncbi:ribosome recycling factor [Helicobacter muridarum]|uniref:Ribosome-recycling factor n=1 Tax=Helicobacter muridarum TaxID=216 RepID=A0A099TZB2_9HELI|nr:ribosome recycling factor [Helicobacter muridarum]TLE00451.1 ribosome recycling factor [Helicobacter muridarum]STQ86425.1 ribosome recycling factor [Helicobacter muridarum]
MLQNIYKDTRDSMQKSLSALQRDFNTLRSNRVSVSILDNIRIDYYGSSTPLSQVATILAQDANTIIITPWEKPLIKDIEKSIQEANIGVNPNTSADSIKLFFPPMTSEQRKEIAKQARTMGEKIKVALRNIRQESNNTIKKLEKDKSITIDESKKGMDEIQKITDEYNKKAESMVKTKEEEIIKI